MNDNAPDSDIDVDSVLDSSNDKHSHDSSAEQRREMILAIKKAAQDEEDNKSDDSSSSAEDSEDDEEDPETPAAKTGNPLNFGDAGAKRGGPRKKQSSRIKIVRRQQSDALSNPLDDSDQEARDKELQ